MRRRRHQTPTGQSAPAPNAAAGPIPSSDTQRDQRAREQIGSEVITITRFGFETQEITRPAGRFFLIIENSWETGTTLGGFDINPRVNAVTTTLHDLNLVAKKTFAYDQCAPVVTPTSTIKPTSMNTTTAQAGLAR